ncbi:DUF4209 domain-containing protein [Gemmatimonas sp.]|uniref:DUF4209 domain-containing protein n=1 Tax=Gemmatimonas sp. TaxID=1962908 RepID=UPI003DA659FD
MDIAELILQLEQSDSPVDEHALRAPFAASRELLAANGEPIPVSLVAEELAFSIHLRGSDAESEWGLVFGPIFSALDENGLRFTVPSLSDVTPAVLDWWRSRARSCPHPVMRGRYAHLLWEMPKALPHADPDAEMARQAIDAYQEAVSAHRYELPMTSRARLECALNLSLAIGDAGRTRSVVDLMIAHEERTAEDFLEGTWGYCIERFLEPPNKRVTLAEGAKLKMIVDLEARLVRLAGKPPGQSIPSAVQKAALLLGAIYRRAGRTDDMKRVLRLYASVVKQLRGTAAPLVASLALERLHSQLIEFHMHQDADDLNDDIRRAGIDSTGDMHPIEVKAEIPTAELEVFIASLLEGPGEKVLSRIAAQWLPRREPLERQMRDIASKAPLQSLVTRTLKDAEGRTVATIGPLHEDPEGNFVAHASQHIQIGAPILRELLRRAFQERVLSVEVVLAFMMRSPCFPCARQSLLQSAIEAYAQEDAPVALHLLIPQVEHAVRLVAIAVNAPIYSDRRGGGKKLRTLDELLRDEKLSSTLNPLLTTDAVPYLRMLLTDPRGWNVRNTVCHGLADDDELSMSVADRVLHAALLLALISWESTPAESVGSAPVGEDCEATAAEITPAPQDDDED